MVNEPGQGGEVEVNEISVDLVVAIVENVLMNCDDLNLTPETSKLLADQVRSDLAHSLVPHINGEVQ